MWERLRGYLVILLLILVMLALFWLGNLTAGTEYGYR